MSRLVSLLALCSAVSFSLTVPASLAAQEPAPASVPTWSVQAVADVGMRLGTRNLGTNSGTDPFLTALAVRAEIHAAPVIGVGLEAQNRYQVIGLRAMARTTLGGTYSGRPGVCALVEGSVCRGHEGDVRVSSLTAEVLFSHRRETDARVTLSLGAGLRHYDFGGLACEVDDPLCQMVGQIQADQLQPMLTFGLGLDGTIEGVPVQLKLQDYFGSFEAGSMPAEGELQNDVIITLGIGFPLR